MFTPEDAKRVEIVPEALDVMEKQIDASIAKFHGWILGNTQSFTTNMQWC